MKFSPLFWPIQLKGNIIYILDETLLPHKLSYIKVRNYKEACRAIKEMKTRAVGQVLLVMYIFLQLIKQNKQRDLLKVARAINSTRPTLSFKYLTDMVIGWSKGKASLEKCILGFLEGLKYSRMKQAEEASKLLKDGDAILTHCNVSGLMPLIGEFAKKQGKRISFFATETRPYLQGSRLTAWELQRAGLGVTIITDGMVAAVMSQHKVNKVIVGADHLTLNGDIANKIGTYQIAITAKYFKIPFYVLCPPASGLKRGRDIKIEIRPDKEMLEYQGLRLAPKVAKGYYPAFDVTPAKLITKHIHLEIKR
ncbi:MAG: S-methyl-5-thioribose-1-phosphate isomerase [Candidatus Omnitrophica bacterium CG08_land_8_20_14_0_20_41_16]|uniref:S-methyl-5-thioribose-1-phosphate isomerase n=1 Tax=Candidatus Sherwoodlollariibacterium unditelluris TaxID=1974757 RepID=A0A2G9YKE8_9BACT|nr:MAG: S-methyl-5-thioribose-1-phosphate isomerase [Candidatus Omnitrophica bacterium CG23_combo_of_CG06-09_8_20_14_all_41_10]PIS34118.1 MAG: S-methyl-5-thioribose-1-phosphate isomerase [Candidatus Omnitrophica bacterium CG08_land_8_20_14_0_20_41_16]